LPLSAFILKISIIFNLENISEAIAKMVFTLNKKVHYDVLLPQGVKETEMEYSVQACKEECLAN
jgi:hypothetical protein